MVILTISLTDQNLISPCFTCCWPWQPSPAPSSTACWPALRRLTNCAGAPLLFWRAQGDPATCAPAAQTIRRKDPLRSNRCLDLGIKSFTAHSGGLTRRDQKVDTANNIKTFLYTYSGKKLIWYTYFGQNLHGTHTVNVSYVYCIQSQAVEWSKRV